MATKLLISLIFLSLFSFSTSLSSKNLLEAVEIMSNSDFNTMALILDFGSETLIPQSRSLTIFSPSDSAFALSGQPSLSLIQFHFSPNSLPLQTLKSLPSGAKIPTFFVNHSITVTSSSSSYDNRISLNNVTVNVPPIYDNGSLVIFGIDKFLDPNVGVQGYGKSLGCVTLVNFDTLLIFIIFASLFLYIF